ncbi:hypothetical protein CRUP_035586 [Coryphaenoides rupestris]|nr:hypothetical protein CRUP_035586 [Coryphaenoides rupestris]
MGKTEMLSLYKGFLDCLGLCLSSQRRSSEENPATRGQDSESGHLIYQPGDVLQDRYEIINTLGEGTFGKVVQCVDNGREAAKLEITVLETINQKDPHNRHLCVQMLDWFQHAGHVCISFELLSLSTFDFLKRNNFLPYPVHQIRQMARQICIANYLQAKAMDHYQLLDLLEKTLEYEPSARIALSSVLATFDHEHHSLVISTRHYRAPEVILELGWCHPCDVWSIGCILLEYYSGTTLFQNYLQAKAMDHYQLLDLLEKTLEYEPSARIALSSVLSHSFFLPPPLLHQQQRYSQMWSGAVVT